MADNLSRAHTEYFLRRERQTVEALKARMGSETVDKLDRILLRDVIYDDKLRDFNALFDSGDAEGERNRRANAGAPSYKVIISLRSGILGRAPGKRPLSKRERRQHVDRVRSAGEFALKGLVEALDDLGIEVELRHLWITHSVVAEVDPDQLEQVAARQDVWAINSSKPRLALTLDKSRPLIQADQVENNLGFDGTETQVAILDTGIDTTHPALTGVVGFQQDYTGEGTQDDFGHGTHCAGIVASRDGTRRGVAPGCSLINLKIIDSFGSVDPADAVQALTDAMTMNVDVASNSWGFSHANGAWVDPDDSCILCVAANNLVGAGVVVVVASGNEGDDNCSSFDTKVRCPGNARSVITVGASDDSDNMASFSSPGPTADGRTKPDVTAPGVEIGSARASGTSMGSPIDANWTNSDGTSMACPHVSGVAALMLEKNTTLTPADVKATMMATAVDIGATPDEMGSGRIDALACVNAV